MSSEKFVKIAIPELRNPAYWAKISASGYLTFHNLSADICGRVIMVRSSRRTLIFAFVGP